MQGEFAVLEGVAALNAARSGSSKIRGGARKKKTMNRHEEKLEETGQGKGSSHQSSLVGVVSANSALNCLHAGAA
jgi:hypothetical protein